MKDYQELYMSIQKLVSDQEFDININIPVTGVTYGECLEINKKISNTHLSPISFSDTRIIYPHVTLRMGTVSPGALGKIFEKLSDYVPTLKPITLIPQPVILKEPNRNYYFSEIYDERLIAISKDLYGLLETEIIKSEFRSDKDNIHHISLGYKNEEDIVAQVLGMKLSEFVADRINVSVKGSNGVCLGSLKTIPL